MSSLLHQLALGIWAMRPEAVEAYLPQVESIMRGDTKVEQTTTRTDRMMMEEMEVFFMTREGARVTLEQGRDLDPHTKDLVAVLPISGPIMKDDFCGSAGTSRMSKWLAEFDQDPAIAGVVQLLDSPGGNGYGMLTMTRAIEKMSKPVVSIVDHGMACSACYGIGAAGDLLFSTSDVDEFGSIGTYVRLRDTAGRDEKEGIKTHVIRATRSVEKNRDFDQALLADPKNENDPHYEAIRKNYIDPFNDHFIELVQRNRPGMKDENGVLSGKVFMAKDALKYGLIDSTGQTLEAAVAAVRNFNKAA